MNKIVVQTLMDEMQRENIKLKEEIVRVRRDLSNFQRIMIEQLTKIDKAKVIYQSPLECLNAFAQELQSNFLNYSEKQSQIHILKQRLQENKKLIYATSNDLTEITSKYKSLQLEHKKLAINSTKLQQKLSLQVASLKKSKEKLKSDLETQIKMYDLQQINHQEQKRVAVAAVVHSSREEMVEYRIEVQKDFMKQSVKLRQQIKQKDEMFKKLAKNIINLEKNSQNRQPAQWDKMSKIISSIVKLEELNSAISLLRQENSAIRRQLKDLSNKKISLQVKINDLKTQLMNYHARYQYKNAEHQQLKQNHERLLGELEIEKKGNQNLEKYYEQKWHSQFQSVKRHLQKSYDEKIIEHEKELQMKKSQVTRRILSYTFIHEQDEKKIKELTYIRLKQEKEIENLTQKIKFHKEEIQSQKRTLFQFNLMAVQQEISSQQEVQAMVKGYNFTIAKLQQQIAYLTSECTSSQVKISISVQQIESKFQQQKRQFIKMHELQLEQLERKQELKLKAFEEQKQDLVLVYLRKQDQIKESNQKQLQILQQKYKSMLIQKAREVQAEKARYKQFVVKAFSSQKILKREIKQLKDQLQQKIRDYQAELQKKKAILRFQNEKAEKDTTLKKQLRQLLQIKILQIKELNKQKQQVLIELEAKQSQINHLSHELQQYKYTRNDWLQLTQQIRLEFFEDYSILKANYMRQINIFKSKIWELQNIILKRPIRMQDQLKIRNLSEQKKQLQEKIQIKQAQNGVLKQIKHYYQIRNESLRQNSEARQQSEVNLGNLEYRKALIMSKRTKKKRQLNFDKTKSDLGEQGDGSSQIRLMKRYIFKSIQHRESAHRKIKEEQRTNYKTAYNHKISIVSDIQQ